MDRPLLFFDSGVKGLPYLEMAKSLLPAERFVYLADRKNFPYGEKTTHSLITLILESMERAISMLKPKLVVIACNTASVVALSLLREKFLVPFIGVVPAIKPAAERLKSGKLGVLATRQTVSDIYLDQLIENFTCHCEVVKLPLTKLVDLVEYHFFNASSSDKIQILNQEIGNLKDRGISMVVLGCTHFILLENELKNVLGDQISIVDSREGVTKQLVKVLKESGQDSAELKGEHQFYLTGSDQSLHRYRLFAEEYGLCFRGVLE